MLTFCGILVLRNQLPSNLSLKKKFEQNTFGCTIVSKSKKHKNKWFLLYTLINNINLIQLRKTGFNYKSKLKALTI